jgi:MFS family permease
MLGMVWWAVAVGLPVPLFFDALGATGTGLGILFGLRQFAMLAQLPAAFLVERLKRRKPFWAACCIVQRLLWAVPGLLPWVLPDHREVWALVTAIALTVSEILGNMGTAPWFSWMAELVPPGSAGRFWGMRFRLLSGVVVLAVLGTGWVLDRFPVATHGYLGFSIVFLAGALFGTADIVLHCWVEEPMTAVPVAEKRSLSIAERWGTRWERILSPLRDAQFRAITIAFGVWSAAIAMPGIFVGLPGVFHLVYLREAFAVSFSEASWFVVAAAVGGALWPVWIGKRVDRFGAARVSLALFVLGPLASLVWLLVLPGRIAPESLGSLSWLLPSGLAISVAVAGGGALIMGGIYGMAHVCETRLSQAHTPERGRTVAMGVHWSLVGLIAAPGPFLAGWIKDHYPAAWRFSLPWGTQFDYFQLIILLHAFVAIGLATPLLARCYRWKSAEGLPRGRGSGKKVQ